MSADRSVQIDGGPTGEAWQEIEAALEELSKLAKSKVGAEELHGRLLARLTGALGAVGGLVWKQEAIGALQIECQANLGEALGGDSNELARHRRLAEGVADNLEARVVPAAYRDAEVSNASPWLAILCPIVADQRAVAVVELFLQPESRSAVLEGYVRLVRTACELVEEYHRGLALEESRRREGELVEVVEYLERIHQSAELQGVAAVMANESRRLLRCDRVSVLANWGGGSRVVAISGLESFDRRSSVVRALELVARTGVANEESVWLPEQGEDFPPHVAEQVEAMLDETHAKAVGLVPIPSELEESQTTVGLMAIERFAAGFGLDEQRQALRLAKASGAALAKAMAYEQIPLRGFLQWLAAVVRIGPGRRWSPAVAVTAAVLVVAAVLCLVPADFTVEARGEAMPQRRQHVFAPSDGVVIDLPLANGEKVRKGELLAKLHSPQLDIDASELMGKARTVQEQLVAAETASLRGELEQGAGLSRGEQTARVLQLQEELRGLEAQLEIVRQQQSALDVKSPLDGIVVTWDVQRQLAGRPVKRGDSLVTVTDPEGPWELLLEIPDRSVGHVLAARKNEAALNVSFQLGTQPGNVGRGNVAFIAPATELSDQSQPAVRATVELKEAPASFRPGATVVARVHCGRRSLGYVWLHELWEAIRLRLFV